MKRNKELVIRFNSINLVLVLLPLFFFECFKMLQALLHRL